MHHPAFSSDSAKVAIPLADHKAVILDVATGRPVGSPLVGPFGKYWRALAFNPIGTRILTVSSDDTARIWDSTTGQPIGKPIEKRTVQAVFSPDGTKVLTFSSTGEAQIWGAKVLGRLSSADCSSLTRYLTRAK